MCYEVGSPSVILRGLFFRGPIECDCLVHRSGFAQSRPSGGQGTRRVGLETRPTIDRGQYGKLGMTKEELARRIREVYVFDGGASS